MPLHPDGAAASSLQGRGPEHGQLSQTLLAPYRMRAPRCPQLRGMQTSAGWCPSLSHQGEHIVLHFSTTWSGISAEPQLRHLSLTSGPGCCCLQLIFSLFASTIISCSPRLRQPMAFIDIFSICICRLPAFTRCSQLSSFHVLRSAAISSLTSHLGTKGGALGCPQAPAVPAPFVPMSPISGVLQVPWCSPGYPLFGGAAQEGLPGFVTQE